MLMGHSLKSVRGRPVYGADVDLELRALLAEKVVFPTPAWMPRTHADLDAAIDEVLTSRGFRRP